MSTIKFIAGLMAVVLALIVMFSMGCNEPRSIETTVLNQSDAIGWKVEQQAQFTTLNLGTNYLTVITAPDGQRFLYVVGPEGRGSIAPMRDLGSKGAADDGHSEPPRADR